MDLDLWGRQPKEGTGLPVDEHPVAKGEGGRSRFVSREGRVAGGSVSDFIDFRDIFYRKLHLFVHDEFST